MPVVAGDARLGDSDIGVDSGEVTFAAQGFFTVVRLLFGGHRLQSRLLDVGLRQVLFVDGPERQQPVTEVLRLLRHHLRTHAEHRLGQPGSGQPCLCNGNLVEQTVSDLHTLLAASGETGPYVLVGASIGGVFIQAYNHAFPEEVAGLVFTNSAGRVGLVLKDGGGLIWDLTEEEIRCAYPMPASARGPAPTRAETPFDRLPVELQAVRLWLSQRFWEKSDPDKSGPEMILSWRKEFLREFEQTSRSESPLGALPVVVVSSDPPAAESERRLRNNAVARLDSLSSNTLHITAAGSGHEIHLHQPDKVVEGVGIAVAAVRSGRAVRR